MSTVDDIQFFAATDVGRKREHNEDNFLVDRDIRLFVVADGMGGHAAGEVASAIAVRTMHQVVFEQRDILEQALLDPSRSNMVLQVLKRGVQTASRKIFAAAERDPSKRGMGTTMSALLLGPQRGYIAHVGDSRIYLLRKMSMQQLTDDHTVANELLRLGMIGPDELDKVPKKNSITRAVGVYEHVDVDSLTVDVLPADQFVLASDGLTGYLDDTDTSLLEFGNEPDGEKAVRDMISFANRCGGKDNITALMVRVGGEAEDRRAARISMARAAMQNTPLFAKLTERERLHVLQVATVSRYEEDEVVVQKGDVGEEMFVTIDGKLRVSIGDTELRLIEVGEHFGEMALLSQQPRTATVTAVDASEVLVIRRDRFFELIRSDSRLAVKLLWQFLAVLSQRLVQTSHDLHDAREDLPGALSSEPAGDPFSAANREALETIRYAAMKSERADSLPPPRATGHSLVQSSPAPAEEVPPATQQSERPPPELDLTRETLPANRLRTLQEEAANHDKRAMRRTRPAKRTLSSAMTGGASAADDTKKTMRRVPGVTVSEELEKAKEDYKRRLDEARENREE